MQYTVFFINPPLEIWGNSGTPNSCSSEFGVPRIPQQFPIGPKNPRFQSSFPLRQCSLLERTETHPCNPRCRNNTSCLGASPCPWWYVRRLPCHTLGR